MSGTEYPGPGDEWQARLKTDRIQEGEERLRRAALLGSWAARIAERKIREERARRVFPRHVR